eukprot:1159186-Pelagomonas_calceolata.AAC.3
MDGVEQGIGGVGGSAGFVIKPLGAGSYISWNFRAIAELKGWGDCLEEGGTAPAGADGDARRALDRKA